MTFRNVNFHYRKEARQQLSEITQGRQKEYKIGLTRFKKNLNLTIIGPTRTLKIQVLTINKKIFGPTKVGVVGPAPPAL